MAHARNTVLLDFMDDETIGAVQRATRMSKDAPTPAAGVDPEPFEPAMRRRVEQMDADCAVQDRTIGQLLDHVAHLARASLGSSFAYIKRFGSGSYGLRRTTSDYDFCMFFRFPMGVAVEHWFCMPGRTAASRLQQPTRCLPEPARRRRKWLERGRAPGCTSRGEGARLHQPAGRAPGPRKSPRTPAPSGGPRSAGFAA